MTSRIDTARRSGWRRKTKAAALGALLALGVAPSVGRTTVADAATSGTTRFVPLAPNRILDTRPNGDAADGPKGYVNAQGSIKLQVTGRGGVPAGATAVVMNVTATESGGKGFVTVWPSGEAQPEASNLNVERAGQTIPNLTVVQLGTDGAVNLFAQSGAHLIADVSGYFSPADTATAGRFIPTKPTRVVDTRFGTGVRLGVLGTGETLLTSLSSSIGLSGYSAAVLNVTATDSTAAGFVTVWPGGGERPTASNLNVERAGQTIPNLVIVPLGPSATIDFYTQNATNLVADLVGLFTDATVASSGQGLFIPQSPARVLDTRTGKGFGALSAASGATLTVPTTSSDVGAVLGNVTATEAQGKGFVTVWPGEQDRPDASNLNVDAGQTIPNLVISGVSAQHTLNFYSQAPTQMLMDLAGVFTTSPAITPTPPPTQGPPGDGGKSKFKIFYAYPKDQPAPDAATQIDLKVKIRHEVTAMQEWLRSVADGRDIRFSGLPDNTPDIFIVGDQLNAAQQQISPIYNGLVAGGLVASDEMALILVKDYPGCAEGRMVGQAGVIAICSDGVLSSTSVGFDYVAANFAEVAFQALGVVPTCALHSDGGHYLTAGARHNDLFYEGADRLPFGSYTVELDAAHIEYYGHGRSNCYDLKKSAIWRTP